jgi:hypothetical protein
MFMSTRTVFNKLHYSNKLKSVACDGPYSFFLKLYLILTRKGIQEKFRKYSSALLCGSVSYDTNVSQKFYSEQNLETVFFILILFHLDIGTCVSNVL